MNAQVIPSGQGPTNKKVPQLKASNDVVGIHGIQKFHGCWYGGQTHGMARQTKQPSNKGGLQKECQ